MWKKLWPLRHSFSGGETYDVSRDIGGFEIGGGFALEYNANQDTLTVDSHVNISTPDVPLFTIFKIGDIYISGSGAISGQVIMSSVPMPGAGGQQQQIGPIFVSGSLQGRFACSLTLKVGTHNLPGMKAYGYGAATFAYGGELWPGPEAVVDVTFTGGGVVEITYFSIFHWKVDTHISYTFEWSL